MVWGEEVNFDQAQVSKFLLSGAEGSQVSKKQSTLPVLTGNHWMAYTLAKEMAWQAVDRAWSLAGEDDWVDWSPNEFVEDVPGVVLAGQSHGFGTAQKNGENILKLTSPFLKEGWGEGAEIKKRGRKKKQLPGVSADQKSVRDFFSVGSSVRQTGVMPGKPDMMGVMVGCGVGCENNVVSENSENRQLCEQKDICPERIYTTKTCLKGGEGGENYDKLKGGNRAICYIESPISKRLVKKSGSVAEMSTIFQQKGVGGGLKNQQKSKETLTTDISQKFRQKLAKFKPI